MKKILLFALFCTLLLVCFGIFASASDEDRIENVPPQTESTEEPPASLEDLKEEEDTEEISNFFNDLYQVYNENRGELFSLLSAVVSLLLVFVYQKGLLPVLKNGITFLEGQVKALREGNSEAKVYSEKLGEQTLSLALAMQNSTKEIQALTESLLSHTTDNETRDEELQKMRQCILWQAKLLGEVFLSSSLPEYSKENVSHVIAGINQMLEKKND